MAVPILHPTSPGMAARTVISYLQAGRPVAKPCSKRSLMGENETLAGAGLGLSYPQHPPAFFLAQLILNDSVQSDTALIGRTERNFLPASLASSLASSPGNGSCRLKFCEAEEEIKSKSSHPVQAPQPLNRGCARSTPGTR